jgi:hypothetical protein
VTDNPNRFLGEWIHPPEPGMRPEESGGWFVIGGWQIQAAHDPGAIVCGATGCPFHGGSCVCRAIPHHEHPHFCCTPGTEWAITAVRRMAVAHV